MGEEGAIQVPQAPAAPAEQHQSSAAGVKAWASDGAPPPEDRLRQLEPGEKPGSARHPFRTIDRDAYLNVIRGSGIARRSLTAPIALVKLDDLVAIQGSVNAERVGHHLAEPRLYEQGARAPGHGMLVDRPVVVRKNGMLFLHDGHHRLTAAHLRGASTAKVRFVDLDAP